ncbi:hypothetical protein [Tahibacter harae]|uniref:AAA domain-containing protein n=1 Tax=Tahibacter harae TaxID=2963937 RepID=A0ABT1QRR4_9GAMM|nr:hypothetical protein [Tahibacter harae]MCQ4164985.1 hypothetical protein [Tahibacter harae]
MSLRKKLAEFGFESNDDYDYPLRCLFEAEIDHLRCLNISGSSGRRKTALANALGHALEYPHLLYHDFSSAEPPPAPIVLSEEAVAEGGTLEAPLSAFERSLSEACAYSEGARTLLILDQLQAADFHDHIRLYHFVQTREWHSPQGSAVANPNNLLLVLISEEALYHSLAKVSFRIHADVSRGYQEYRPEDFGLSPGAAEFMAALDAVFHALGASPTPREYAHILHDVHQRVRTEEQLRQSLFGWMEHADRSALYAVPLEAPLAAAVQAISRYLGIEEIELGS